jgi:hypothetical protein
VVHLKVVAHLKAVAQLKVVVHPEVELQVVIQCIFMEAGGRSRFG